MSDILEDETTEELPFKITPDIANDDFSRYMIDRMHQLEQRNHLLREQHLKIEAEKRHVNSQKLKYERELRQLHSEIERLKTAPFVVGTIVDVLENEKLIVRSSTGPQFVVGLSKFIKESELEPGTKIAMNQQTLAVLEILPPSKSHLITGVEVMESPNVDYSRIGGLDDQPLTKEGGIGVDAGKWTTTIKTNSAGTFVLPITATDGDGSSATTDVTLTAGPIKYTLSLNAEWNMISLPCNVTTSGIDTTQKLGDLITDSGVDCEYVVWFDAASQKMVSDIINPPDGVPQDTTYPITAGQGYFVFVAAAHPEVVVAGTQW